MALPRGWFVFEGRDRPEGGCVLGLGLAMATSR